MVDLSGKVAPPTGRVAGTRPSKSGNGQATMTVTVPQDSNNIRFKAMRVLPVVSDIVNRGSLEVTRKNEGVLPPQLVPVEGRLCQFVEGWKRIRNDPYVLSIVAKGYRFRFTNPPLLPQTPWEI